MRAKLLSIGLLCGLALSLPVTPASAALIWNPERGWYVEGGVLDGIVLQPQENDNALALMNNARKAQQENPQSGSALDWYKDVLTDYPDSVYAPEALFQRAIIYRARGQFETAAGAFDDLLSRYPDYPNFNQVISAMFFTAQDVQDGKTFYLWGTIPWFSDSRVALRLYEAVVKNAPFSDYAPLALMNIALVHRARGEPEEAILALDRLTNTYPQSTLSGDAYLELAETHAALVQGPDYDQNATRQALSFYQDYLIIFPHGADTALAREGVERMRETLAKSKYDIGEFYYVYRNDLQAAQVFFSESITEAPLSNTAEDARKQLDRIEKGILAPSTPIDWILGRYPAPNRSGDGTAKVDTGSFSDPFSYIAAPGMDDSNIQRAAETAEGAKADAARRKQPVTSVPQPKTMPKPIKTDAEPQFTPATDSTTPAEPQASSTPATPAASPETAPDKSASAAPATAPANAPAAVPTPAVPAPAAEPTAAEPEFTPAPAAEPATAAPATTAPATAETPESAQ